MRNAIDDSLRRRIYLLRHAEAAYQNPDGTVAPDPRLVPLTAHGRVEAEQMGELLAPLELDHALCSGLPRTLETARIVLGDRALEPEIEPDLEELRAGWQAGATPAQVAYAMRHAAEPGASFLGGEPFAAFAERVSSAFERRVRAARWRTALFVCHGGTNGAILRWALGAGLEVLASLEQDSCCLNIIDVDIDEASGQILRRFVRAVNLTVYDLPKRELRLTSMEQTALAMTRFLEARERNAS